MKVSLKYILAARIADPATRSQVDPESAVEWSQVLKALTKNKVPLYGMDADQALSGCPMVSEESFKAALNGKAETRNSQRDEYGKLRQALLKQGIESVLIKSCGLPPSFPYTSDNLDTLVRMENVESSRQVLNDLGYVELRNIEEPKKWLFRKFKGGESVSAVHLHGLVGWGVPFLDDAILWKRAQVSEDDAWVTVPSPEDALLVTIAHAFYENKSFKLLDIARIRFCLHQGNIDFANVERIARERGWEEGLYFCLLIYSQLEKVLYGETLIPQAALERAKEAINRNFIFSLWLRKVLKREEAHFPFRVSFFLGKVAYYKKVLKDSRRKFSSRLYDVITTLVWGVKHKLKIGGQRGMVISLCGIDGSGKTVHSRALSRAFETSEIKTRIYWSRFGSSASKDDSLPGKNGNRHSDIAASLSRRRQKLQNPLARFGWLTLNMTKYVFRCIWKVGIPRLLGRVVICDRYIYSTMVEIEASMPDTSRWTRRAEWLLTHLCPRPHVAWLLDVPPDIGVVRQADENGSTAAEEELARHRSRFQSLASAYGLRVLQTRTELESSTSRVVRESMLTYYKDYRTWINALLLANPNQRNPRKGT